MSLNKHVARKASLGMLFFYVVFYMLLSLNGSYQADAIDLRGVMSYSWAPVGFYYLPAEGSEMWKQDHLLFYLFLPLLSIDRSLIHPPRRLGDQLR